MGFDLVPPPMDFPAEWKLARLKDLCSKIGSGATPTGGQAAYLSRRERYALIRSQNVYDRRFSPEGLAFISDDQASKLKGVELQEQDVLLNITGDGITFGRACIVDKHCLPACVNQHVSIIRVDPDRACPEFILCYLTHPVIKEYIESFNAGGSRRAITKGHIESFVIPLPPMDQQKEIARTLQGIDDKIALLRETNATLEAVAQAIFKSWFVDFDPVRAKAEGRDPEGVPPEVADLFPSEFEESELGAIPKGWRVDSLENHLDVVRGLSYKGSGLTDASDSEGVPMHNLNSVLEGGGYKYAGLKYYKGEFKPKHEVQAGDIIVANTEQGHKHLLIGFPALIPDRHGKSGLFSHHLYRVRPNSSSPLGSHFTYLLLMTPAVREQVIGCSNGTTVNMLKADGLSKPRFVCPPKQVVEAFEDACRSLMARQESSITEAEALAALRDTLLPRLMSGKLRIER